MIVNLNEEEIKNLAVFLDRVQVTGVTEASALAVIAQRLNEAINNGEKQEKEIEKKA